MRPSSMRKAFIPSKNGLPVMQCQRRRTDRKVRIGHDLRVLPFSMSIVTQQHMIGNIFFRIQGC